MFLGTNKQFEKKTFFTFVFGRAAKKLDLSKELGMVVNALLRVREKILVEKQLFFQSFF